MGPIGPRGGHDRDAEDGEESVLFDTTRLGKHLTRRIRTGVELKASTGETVDPEQAGRISLTPPVIAAFVILGTFALAVAIQEEVKSHSGVYYWSVMSDTRLPRKFAVPAYSDATAWFIVISIALLPLLYVRLCRQIEMLLDVGTIERMTSERAEAFSKLCSGWETRFRKVSNRKGTVVLAVSSGLLALGALVSAYRVGPVRGLLRASLSTMAHMRLQRHWWLDPFHEPIVSIAFWLILSFGVFLLAKQLLVLTATYHLFGYLRQAEVKATIDINNSDGHYGLEPFRQFLKNVLILGIIWILITSTFLFVWIGPDPVSVSMGIVATAACVGALALPMGLIADSIRKGKGECLASIENHQHVIEQSIHRRLTLWASTRATAIETSDDTVIVEYWKLLQSQHADVLDIPSTGFRYREFLYSTVTLLLVPVTLLVIGALIR